MLVSQSPLGKKTQYIAEYQPDLLFPISRQINRDKIGVPTHLPFKGMDVWNMFELSWLNAKGKPVVAAAEFIFPCESLNIVESKSFKLYLNSFNNSQFETVEKVAEIIQNDLSQAVKADVKVKIFSLDELREQKIKSFGGFCLDQLDIACDVYTTESHFLKTEGKEIISENLYSDLLKSNCLVTSQPDWGSVEIHYTGKKINHEGLLRYVVSFRNTNEFAEQCAERIFMDIMRQCAPEKLSVHARFTRRGGLDINPYRSTENNSQPENIRLVRQ